MVTSVTDQNFIHEEIWNKFNSENSCERGFQNLMYPVRVHTCAFCRDVTANAHVLTILLTFTHVRFAARSIHAAFGF